MECPLLSGLLCPGLQALDEQYIGRDFQFGDVDQVRLCLFFLRSVVESCSSLSVARCSIPAQDHPYLPRLGYAKRAHLMNAMVPGLTCGKMSASDANSKIDFLDSPAIVKKKNKLPFCKPGNITENELLAFTKAVLWPISELRIERIKWLDGGVLEKGLGDQRPLVSEDGPEGSVFTVSRPEKFGGPVHNAKYEDLERDFAEQVIHREI